MVIKKNLSRNKIWWFLEDIIKIWLESLWQGSLFNILTLARISPRNIYLNLFGGAHFPWRSLKTCNIAKRTCLSHVWMAIFPWSYCTRKVQILCQFRARSSKTVECRFTLKRVHDMIIIYSFFNSTLVKSAINHW